MRYGKYSGRGNFFSLPNEVFLLGLSAGELAVYSFLKRCENRKTHQCWPSIKTIGQVVRMSENTVRKYIRQLEGNCTPPTLRHSDPVSYTHLTLPTTERV